MKQLRAAAILALFLFALSNSACIGDNSNANMRTASNRSNSTGENVVTAKDNIEELGMVVELPLQPEEATWREDTAVRPSGNAAAVGKKLTAVLRFSQQDADKLAADRADHLKPPVNATISPEEWFPPELIAQSDLSGDDTLRGNSYSAQDFYSGPYSEGRLIRIENTDYFILELYSQ